MTTMVWLLSGMTVVLVLLAGLVWHGAQQATQRRMQQAFVDAQIGQRTQGQSARATDDPVPAGPARIAWRGPKRWDYFLLRAGVEPTRVFYLGHLLVLAMAVLLGWILGPVSLITLVFVVVVGAYARLWLKQERRRQAMVRQLPEFLDRVVRMMTVGHSIGAAFHHAANTSVAPLSEVMGTAVSLHRSGQDLDLCIRHVSRQYNLQELYLIAAVVGIAIRFGGRSDHVLERMAAFMRDLEQARNEMVAMSAELRLSAWVLALLPLGLTCFILVFNNDLFMGMWHDPVGARLLFGAALLQIVGSYWLYRLAKSV